MEQSAIPIAAGMLLAGGLRPSPLARAAGRSPLDLYLTPTKTVLGLWLDRLEQLGGEGSVRTPARVLYGDSSTAPTRAGVGSVHELSIERESSQYRGPAGVLADACARYDPDCSVLVCDAARFLTGDLHRMLQDHLARGADITVACDQDSAPAGLYLIRCGVFSLAPRSGFMDLKEQLLDKALKAGKGIWVHRLGERRSYPLRTRAQFLLAAGAASGPIAASRIAGGFSDPVPDSEAPSWSVIAPDAEVEAGAVVVHSVVMPGALVGRGSVVARSLVCPGARVEPGARVVDAVVTKSGVRSDPEQGGAGA